jgi:hypothetical protein
MSLGARLSAFPAACFGVQSRVRWLLERVLPCNLTVDYWEAGNRLALQSGAQ